VLVLQKSPDFCGFLICRLLVFVVRKLDAANSSSGSWDATCQEKTNNTCKKQDKNYTWFGQYCLRPQSTPDILIYHFE
jgi:hypothetical protein